MLTDLLEYLIVNKKVWLIPIVMLLLCFGGFIILTQGTAVSPFIYTLF